jgi:hypothetical protein
MSKPIAPVGALAAGLPITGIAPASPVVFNDNYLLPSKLRPHHDLPRDKALAAHEP